MSEQEVEELTKSIRAISRGDAVTGPLGFEALTMAIGGQGFPGSNGSVTSSLDNIAEAIRELAEAIRNH